MYLFDEDVVKSVAALSCYYPPFNVAAEHIEIAQEVEQFMAGRFVEKAEFIIKRAFLSYHQCIAKIGPSAQA